MKVSTAKGNIDVELLRVEDHVEWHDNARVVRTRWFLEDEEVRTDIHVEVLRGNPAKASNGETT